MVRHASTPTAIFLLYRVHTHRSAGVPLCALCKTKALWLCAREARQSWFTHTARTGEREHEGSHSTRHRFPLVCKVFICPVSAQGEVSWYQASLCFGVQGIHWLCFSTRGLAVPGITLFWCARYSLALFKHEGSHATRHRFPLVCEVIIGSV